MKRHKITTAELAGILLCVFGAAFALHWLLDLEFLYRVIPGTRQIGLINPLLFLAIGLGLLALALQREDRTSRPRILAGIGLFLIGFPVGYLIEVATGLNLGIDIAGQGVFSTPADPYPGRISPNASLGFMAIGLALWLLGKEPTARRTLACRWLAGAAAVVGTSGLAGHFLGLEALYRIASFNRILPSTSFGLLVGAVGLLALLDRRTAGLRQSPQQTERRINQRSIVVATLVTLSGGIAGFAVMRDTFEQSVSQNMLLTATTTATSLAHAIDVSLWFPRTVATRPTVRQPLAKLGLRPDDDASRELLQKVAESFLTAELTGAEFFDAQGRMVAKAGKMVAGQAKVVHPLSNAGQTAALAWKDGYVLFAQNDVIQDGQRVGKVLTEQRLPLFDSLLAQVRNADETSDATLCSRQGDRALCAPTRSRHQPFDLPLFDTNGQPSLPIVRAVLGERGVMFAKDFRKVDVISAYTPIKDFGIGLAVHTDVDTLYAPLRPRLGYLGAALLGIIGVALYAQRSQIRPVVTRLVESEQRLASILAEQSELVSLATPEGVLRYVNPAYARHFGKEPADLIGASLFDHVSPADREAVRRTLDGVLRDGRPVTTENRMVAHDGSERWVAWTNTVQPDASGPLLHSVGRDITERMRAELALHDNQQALERTSEVAVVGGWDLDLKTGRLRWTDMTRRIHEVDADYVPTLDTAITFYSPKAQTAIASAVEAAKLKGTPWDLELEMRTARGHDIWVRAQGKAEFEAGQPVRLVGAFQDVTERKKLEQKLADNERFIRQITDSLPLRIAYVDRELRYRFVNLAHCRRFGLPSDKIVGRSRSELLNGRSDAAVEAAVAAALTGHEQRFEFEESIDGKLVRIESRLIPDIGNNGQVRGFYSTGVDITERSAAERALRELTTIFDNTTDFVVQADWRGAITYMNPAVRAALGLQAADDVSCFTFSQFNTSQTNQLFADVITPAVKAKGVWIGETTVRVADQRIVPVNHMVIAHRGADGRVSRYSAIMRDISDEIAAKQERERQAATLRSVTEAIPAIVAVVGADGRYRFVNSAFERWYGRPRAEIVGRSLEEVLGPVDHERSLPWVNRVLAGESVSFERDYPVRTNVRHLAVSYIPLRIEDGTVDGFVGVAQDITQHRQEEVRLLQLAQRDALTGLLNRAGFEQVLRGIQTSAGQLLSVALLYIDLDHFKPVNDTYGHPVGDQVLQLFAQRLRGAVRPTDAVARLGGDEFAIALNGVNDRQIAVAVAEKVIAAALTPFDHGDLQLRVGASVGIALAGDSAQALSSLIEHADAMLYQAKAAGRGRYAGP